MSALKKINLLMFLFIFSSFYIFSKEYPDNTYTDIPKDGYQYTENGGKVIRYIYEVKSPRLQENKTYKKSALVYLPYGFDENSDEDKYSVLYLMHGGSQSSEWYFNGEFSGSILKSMLDRMTETGKIKNLIICAPTFNTPYSSGGMGNSATFYKELKNELMPIFEEKYHIIKDREHRAFGGFSMGAMVTWTVFEHCLDDFSFFIPVSGDSWALGGNQNGIMSEATAKHLERMVVSQNKTKDDFKIYAGCGEHEIATPNMVPQIEAMKNEAAQTFIYTENFNNGNLYFILCKGSGHDQITVLRTLYNALPKFCSE
ncbi:MAG: hypothetical protein HUK25_01110 [Treponema sp.]|nr:hypothetical protein [Treponema sp.]